MHLENTDKVTILLSRLDFHMNEIQRRQEKETRLFEWTTTLLLGVFAVLISFSDITSIFENRLLVKIIATFMILFPTVVFSVRIFSEGPSMSRQAKIVEMIQEQLQLYEPGIYVDDQPLYPSRWRGGFANAMITRRTPIYYVLVLAVMAACVIGTLWLIG